ncbi:hypothetical protein FKW77_001717 [Venturia effusa]|uniref:Uncharacterized protein n=1 Tax=Venturia effusa TaxID=50376 RepID=A0A517LI58_9PEZI|nr:hypothetical protein FKW77_001717 [Venturia effusa]
MPRDYPLGAILRTVLLHLALAIYYIYKAQIRQNGFLKAFYLALFAYRFFTVCFTYAFDMRHSMRSNGVKDQLMWRMVLLAWMVIAVKQVAYLLGIDAGF